MLMAFLSVMYSFFHDARFYKDLVGLYVIATGYLVIFLIADILIHSVNEMKKYWLWCASICFSLTLVCVAAFLSLAENCNHACGYPLAFVTIVQYIFSVVLLFSAISSKRKSRLYKI
jgi:uncharacterized phage infection (PIP) family protein YhgE